MMNDNNSKRSIEALSPHPKNGEIYGSDIEKTTKRSIEENGIREPLIIKPDGTIISGHQRWMIAKELGMESVPVTVREYNNEDDELEALLDHNQHREKTPGQKIMEGIQYETVQNFARGTGKTRDQVGERIGMSGENYRKGKSVYMAAFEDGNRTAKHQWEQLMDGEESIHGAYTTVNASMDVSFTLQGSEAKKLHRVANDLGATPEQVAEMAFINFLSEGGWLDETYEVEINSSGELIPTSGP